MMGGAVIPGLLGVVAGRWGLGPASYGISFLLVSLFLFHEILCLLPQPIFRQQVAGLRLNADDAESSEVASNLPETLLET